MIDPGQEWPEPPGYGSGYAHLEATHWFVDWELKSFWPVALWWTAWRDPESADPFDHSPSVTYSRGSTDAAESRVLLGSFDGRVRGFDRTAGTDCGIGIWNYVMYGPIAMDRANYYSGVLQEITGVLAEGSGDVEWCLRIGDTPESVVDGAEVASGVFEAGRNHGDRPRRRGAAYTLTLMGSQAEGWAVENITTTERQAGRIR